MALAQRLSELGQANSQGLINDDEYRLLRQDLFERYSDGSAAVLPADKSVVLLPAADYVNDNSFASSSRVQLHSDASPRRPPPLSPAARAKPSVTAGVSNFLRRATGRKATPKDVSPTQTSTSAPAIAPANSPKRNFIPRLLSRKSSRVDMTSPKPTPAESRTETMSISSRTPRSVKSVTFSPPNSPTKSTRSPITSQFAVPSTPIDVFDDGGLSTSDDFRQAIGETETEGKRVLEAFDGLELSTLLRHNRQHDNRLRPTNNISSNPFSPGLNKYPSSSVLLPLERTHRSRSASDANDGVSLRSISIQRLRPSTSKSTSSSIHSKVPNTSRPATPRHTPSSPVLNRKNSVSSISSQSPSLLSVGRLAGISSSSSLSKSTGHLPLGMLAENDDRAFSDTSHRDGETGDADAEIADIRRRRMEVIGRYQARLEYLRARLKSAELHEKLLKK